VENKRLAEKEKAGKKVVKKQPPTKGYVHFDRLTFERLQGKAPEPLQSRFEPTFALLVNLLQCETAEVGGGYGRLVRLIARSHGTEVLHHRHRVAAAQRLRTLRSAGLVRLERIEGYRGAYLRPAEGLQKDFSLFHTLSLYLLDTLPRIPRESETYALDVLSMVESIQENPDQILWKQLDKARGEAVGRMKAEGIEYDDRMKLLEEVEYPKPNRDFVYATFNDFAALHPWVGAENIRPKSVAREMVERFMTFGDYVREYELQRSEGLLLRYLSESYKTVVQTVPEGYRDEVLDDVIAFLRTTVRGVDSSLLDEWERMRDPTFQAAPLEAAVRPVGPPPIWMDKRGFAARLRTELHRLLMALARKDWAAAAEAIRDPEGAWTPARLEAELAPYFEAHPYIDVTPASRKPHQTFIKELAPRRWEAVQRLVDEAGEVDWMIQCEVDLTGDFDPDRPVIGLLRVGA